MSKRSEAFKRRAILDWFKSLKAESERKAKVRAAKEAVFYAGVPGYHEMLADPEYRKLIKQWKATEDEYSKAVAPLDCKDRLYDDLSDEHKRIVDAASRRRFIKQQDILRPLHELRRDYDIPPLPDPHESAETVADLVDWFFEQLELVRQHQQLTASPGEFTDVYRKVGLEKAVESYRACHFALERLKAVDRPARTDPFESLDQAEIAMSALFAWLQKQSVVLDQSSENWITVREAALVTGVTAGTISRAADDENKIKTNGKTGRDRRLFVPSLLKWAANRSARPESKESDAHVQRLLDEAEGDD